VRCGFSGAALVEKDAAVVRGIEIAPMVFQSFRNINHNAMFLPIAILYSSTGATMKVNYGDACWIATFFIID
jgi:hypothetical protein